ncbi:amidohydrolase family protein [Aurantibacter sp.]|uniref:amidohydrolase family protein n=1 Tax=Aurantibacter sp. TaxID=2807103 RepID=UPI0032658961
MKKYIVIYGSILFVLFSCKENVLEQVSKQEIEFFPIEVNHEEIKIGDNIVAIVDVSLFDGIADSTIHNSTVIVRNGIIDRVGLETVVEIPEEAVVVNGQGLTLMPGLIDAHFHYDHVKHFPTKFVRNGVTSVRDPGQWIEAFDFERQTGDPLPRLFLTGPHIDSPPPSWPKDSYMVRDEAEVKEAMDYLIRQNVSAIKIYHRLPLGLIKEVCDIAHANGLPVTAHLEITDARQAILAGLDGVEHVTSLGTALVSKKRAEEFRQEMLANNKARLSGRLEMWRDIDVNGKKADSLINFLEVHQTFFTPTLGPYEYRIEGDKKDSTALIAFQRMCEFIGRCVKADIRIAVGSHGPWVPYADRGWSYQHEMDLLAKSGMANIDIMKAATMVNAEFLKIDHRLGSIEKGKEADLILIKGDPESNIRDMFNIERVMLNGVWLD